MGDRIWERIVVLPFFIGCSSESSVDVATTQPTKPETRRRESKEAMKMKKFWGLHRLVKSFKSFSQLFVYKEEKEEDMETEMEIGFPTDVKHVTHIGWDGTTTTNPVKGWENLTPPELLSFPSISLKQFELAMAAQAGAPLCLTTTSKFT